MKLNQAQQAAIKHVYEYGQAYLIGAMGSGKTAIALHAIKELIHDDHVKRALVVAPLKVCEQIWCQESAKWHTGLTIQCAIGKPQVRQRVLDDARIQVVVINFENLAWLFQHDGARHFDMLVLDEVTKLKAGGAGFKALRKHIKSFNTRLVMSATPVEESWEGLFYPFMAVDNGAALGRNKQTFMQTYFISDYSGYKWTLQPGAAKRIFAKVEANIILLPDYRHELPDLCETHIKLRMPPDAEAQYKAMQRDFLLTGVTAVNAAVMTGKLQQIACGFVYGDDGNTQQIHLDKLDALTDLLQGLPDSKIVIVYQFEEEIRRLRELLSDVELTQDIGVWKCSAIPYLAIHPRSAGHGVDLTLANTVIFMSPLWSRDLTQQTIGRVWRRGQAEPVMVFTLIAEGTIEEQVCIREGDKAKHHQLLMAHLTA